MIRSTFPSKIPHSTILVGLFVFGSMSPVQAQMDEMSFEGFLFPDTAIVGSTRSLTMCLVNQGSENELVRDGVDEDHFLFSIPLGPNPSDLESNGDFVDCSTREVDWTCSVNSVHDFGVAATTGCGGNNVCRLVSSNLHRGQLLGDVCKDDGGWDCRVYCIAP